MTNSEALPLYDKLITKVLAYFQTIWREKWREKVDEEWMSNFQDPDDDILEREKINMLYLLSKFMFFGSSELRQLLLSLYRDLYKYPIIESIRKSNRDTTDLFFINDEFEKELKATRFLGVGNPSESGVHLLYYFRQECNLSKELFINASDILSTQNITETSENGASRSYLKSEIADASIKRYIFIDDFCGSGNQAEDYLKKIVENIKFENRSLEVNYLMLFGTDHGINNVRSLNVFDKIEAVFSIDESFKTFSDNSRYFKVELDEMIDKDFAEITARKYGAELFNPPLGHGDCQLLFGLFHNTPDNSLPIFWSEENRWIPIFKRYSKIY